MAHIKITMEYDRQKLGKKGDTMTDKQIADLLVMLRKLCRKVIDSVVQQSSLNYSIL